MTTTTPPTEESILEDRRRLISEMAEITNGEAAELQPARAAVDAAAKTIAGAQAALEAAVSEHAQAVGKARAISVRADAQRGRIERRLRETASPQIWDFVQWCDREFKANASWVEAREYVQRNHVSGFGTRVIYSNAAGIQTRLDGITAARREAEGWVFQALTEEEITQRIAALKNGFPSWASVEGMV